MFHYDSLATTYVGLGLGLILALPMVIRSKKGRGVVYAAELAMILRGCTTLYLFGIHRLEYVSSTSDEDIQ